MRWDPFGEMAALRRAMERVFDEYGALRGRGEEPELTFPVDLFETDREVVVKASLPGVKPQDVEVSVTGDSLTIRGESRHEEKVEEENYFRQEIRYGAFARVVPLPSAVRVDGAEAAYRDGVLTVTLPKAEEARAKTIRVRAAEPAGVS
jgi:HSP20 family protein